LASLDFERFIFCPAPPRLGEDETGLRLSTSARLGSWEE